MQLTPAAWLSDRMTTTRSAIRRAAADLVVDRLRGTVTREVRAEVTRQAAEYTRATIEVLNGPEARSLVEEEVRRQVRPVVEGHGELNQWRRGRSEADFSLDLMLGARGTVNRVLNPKHYSVLRRQIQTLTGVDAVDWSLQQAYRSLLSVESRGLGRVAGSTYNILGKLVTPPLLQPPPGPVLEIGTLFGLFAPALMRQFRRAGQSRTLTVVDPFVGTQVQPGRTSVVDPTGTPVTAEVAQRNFVDGGLGKTDVRTLTGLSTDDAVRAAVAEHQYSVVVIDGDHSEDGVYADLWFVQQVTAPLGVVVMDDFGDPNWQGVESGCRRYLDEGGRLELLGTVSTSAYLRMPAATQIENSST